MRMFIVFYLCICNVASLTAQNDSKYQALIAKAGLLHLQENYKEAIIIYEQAFTLQVPDALTAYKAAGVYSLGNNTQKALKYLNIAIESGWAEADYLIADPYFDLLRETEKVEWKILQELAVSREKKYEASLTLPNLRKEINKMALTDQQLRFKRVQAANDSLLVIINDEIYKHDYKNLIRAKEIIKQHGWPGMSEIGKDGQNNLWLVVQHADQDVVFQQDALTAMEKLKGTPQLNMENYAFLYDRVQCNLNYKQRYGTQVMWLQNGEASGFRPIEKEYTVNRRRAKIGMQPLQIYAISYGFVYKEITRKESGLLDAKYNGQVHGLINNAKIALLQKDFQKVYDYYNEASTYAGGMSNSDNLEAAITFAGIASVTNEAQYKSIALDFLALLQLRKVLTIKNMKNPVFNILHQEQRWDDIISQLKK